MRLNLAAKQSADRSRPTGTMEQLWQDLRVAARGLLKDRAFSVTTIATLALCLAANIAIFAVVDGVLLKPLPFAEADRLVSLHNSYPGAGAPIADNGVPDYYDRLTALTALEGLAMYRQNGMTIGGDTRDAERSCAKSTGLSWTTGMLIPNTSAASMTPTMRIGS